MNPERLLTPTLSSAPRRRGSRSLGLEAVPSAHSSREFSRRGFTLLEVMIAVGILFMCLFAVLALLSNSLTSARKLQQRRTIDAGTVAGLIYVQLLNTNQVSEGRVNIDLEEMYPGFKCDVDLEEAATNGLCDIEYRVTDPKRQYDLHSHFLMYLPNLKKGGISGNLPQH
jgi:hypothetical protein